ncbi:putative metallo-beta-lactamase domain protein [Polyplosphaeria fusca]|uniref:Metallo-beta-lactamase domain protein n=1 Tax=Polyplosphaeria fusca TaxID=682080 RepID=A0A9P4RBX0_9PLEO|nr:putative metallo-beta-lactamase domain protein [Polyplosphaeria fusca]
MTHAASLPLARLPIQNQSQGLHRNTHLIRRKPWESKLQKGAHRSTFSHRAISSITTSRRFQHQQRNLYTAQTLMPHQPIVHDIFETKTGTYQYLVADPSTKAAVIIDPVLDYDPATQTITTESADALIMLVEEKGYSISRFLETHAHADHLSASSYLQKQILEQQGHHAPIGIGKRIGQVQQLFSKRYDISKAEYEHAFDTLFEDDQVFKIGKVEATAIHLPGHTPDHMGYKIGDNVFCGDSIFHVDIGTARCDFPGGSATDLFHSTQKLLSLPDETKIWTGHDYPPDGRDKPVPWMSVKHHRELNKHLKEDVSERDFVQMRMERDDGLAAPRLLHPSLQFNVRAGRLPGKTEAGHRFLRLPLKLGELEW